MAHSDPTWTEPELSADLDLDPDPTSDFERLDAPDAGVPEVVATQEGLARAVEAIAAGTGPVAVDAERASGYRYGQKAYLVQVRREGAGTWLIDPVPLGDLWQDGVTVTSSYAGPPADMRVALDLIATGTVDPTATVSHRLPLNQAAEGFRLTAEAGASLKVILAP